jgi:hypothetical protein
MIIVTTCFTKTQHDGVERCHPIDTPSKQHRARS